MELQPAIFDAWVTATVGRRYRPTLALATWQWESGLNPDIVGDGQLTKQELLDIYHDQGLEAAKATGVSIGLGQVNSSNFTPAFNPDNGFIPVVNAQWSADFIQSLTDLYGGDEYLATSAYRGPGVTASQHDWHWDFDRTSWIVNRANQLDAEGVTRAGGGAPPYVAMPHPVATVTPVSATMLLTGFTILDKGGSNG